VIWLVAPAAAQTATFTPDPVDLPAAKREAAVTWYTGLRVDREGSEEPQDPVQRDLSV